jgi:hypothetical protein
MNDKSTRPSRDGVSLAETENAIEIAMNCLESLQDRLDMGRDAIIRNYILPWAREAEMAWHKLKTNNPPDDIPYYDFIDAFAAQKVADLP